MPPGTASLVEVLQRTIAEGAPHVKPGLWRVSWRDLRGGEAGGGGRVVGVCLVRRIVESDARATERVVSEQRVALWGR